MYGNNLNKTVLRKEIQARRNHLSPPEMIHYSEKICRLVTSSTRFFRAQHILLYCNYGSETRTSYIFEAAKKAGKNTYYPKVEGDNMYFYKVNSLSELSDGYRGIKEPYHPSRAFQNSRNNMDSMIIVPGLVFGRDGYRIGYGRGFYDRYLADYPGLWKTGICYGVQIVKDCPHEDHDICMDEIICEQGVITLNGEGEARWI